MGYRSTFITEDGCFKFSDEFVEKYKDRYNFGGIEANSLPISSKSEYKRYWDRLEEDIVKELNNQDAKNNIPYDSILAVWLHEDGEITKVVFEKDGVTDLNVLDYLETF